MAFSKLYHTILDGKFFFDLRRVDARIALIERYLDHDVTDFNATKLSEKEPMGYHVMAAAEMRSQNSYKDAPEGSVAVVNLHGDMLKYGTACEYGADEVAAQIREATQAKNIAGIVLDIDSGGGAVDAIPVLVDAIRDSQAQGKPVMAKCDLCCSAAYYTAIYCDEILADNELSAEFGSIGVMTQFADYAKYYEQKGIKLHTIYSSLSTYKNAGFEAAKEGKYDTIKKELLDPLAEKFQADVKQRRQGKLDEKVEGILNGRTFFAREALKHGLIDGIGNLQVAVQHVRQKAASIKLSEYAKQFR